MSNTETSQMITFEMTTIAKARDVRFDRANALSKCDWTQMPDAPLTAEKKAEWSTYRQALRDLPDQSGFPWNIQWPTKPE